ncbi:MAG: PQQ-binding-like beta-propeller repeat protein [Thermodesulfobacteriota bacterium]|nr:PQQ-binding-like beta-propeller repeat protein [Thermodesulfobacteriota bacterium]
MKNNSIVKVTLTLLTLLLLCKLTSFAEEGDVLWNIGFVHCWSQPAVTEGKIFLPGKDGGFYCINAMTGESLWSNNDFPGNTTSATVSGENVFISTGSWGSNPKTYCFDSKDGSIIWESNKISTGVGIPVVDGKVYLGGDTVCCLDADNGNLIWETSPSIKGGGITIANNEVYVASDRIYCLDISSGEKKWEFYEGDTYFESPVITDTKLIIGTSYPNVNGIYCIDTQSGSKLWKHSLDGNCYQMAPAIYQNMVYITSREGNLVCIDIETGFLIWEREVRAEGSAPQSPIVVDGRVYIQSDDDGICCLSAENGEIIWKEVNSAGISWGGYAIAGKRLYVVYDWNGIYCLDAGDINGIWPMVRFNTAQTGAYIYSESVPYADFSAIPTTGTVPLTVEFTDISTGNINNRLWNFGDGNETTEENPIHVYYTTGDFTVSLTVEGPGGTDIEIKNNYISVSEEPVPCTAWNLLERKGEDINLLREIRDKKLYKTDFGRKCVYLYYHHSCEVNSILKENPYLNKRAKNLLQILLIRFKELETGDNIPAKDELNQILEFTDKLSSLSSKSLKDNIKWFTENLSDIYKSFWE